MAGDWIALIGMGTVLAALCVGGMRAHGWGWLYRTSAQDGALVIELNAAGRLLRQLGFRAWLTIHGDIGPSDRIRIRSGRVVIVGNMQAPTRLRGRVIDATVIDEAPVIAEPGASLSLRGNLQWVER